MLRASRSTWEDGDAATRSVLALTAAVGAMAATASVPVGDPLALIAVPSALLVLQLARRSITGAGAAGTVVWLALVPQAPEEAMVVPLAMALICLAVALGPERLVGWLRDDLRGERAAVTQAEGGWIEEA